MQVDELARLPQAVEKLAEILLHRRISRKRTVVGKPSAPLPKFVIHRSNF
jgi:hypothetical protein